MYANAWSSTTGPNAPLYTCNANSGSVQASVSAWIKSGFPACRLLLGVPGYSHIFKTKTNKIVKAKFGGAETTSFQALDASQPVDPTTTYNGLVAHGVSSRFRVMGCRGVCCPERLTLTSPQTSAVALGGRQDRRRRLHALYVTPFPTLASHQR